MALEDRQSTDAARLPRATRRILIFLGIVGAVARCGGATETPSAARARTIYGADDRHDLYELPPDSAQRRYARSVGLLTIASSLVEAEPGDSVRLVASRFGPTYRLCPDERFYDQPTAGFCTAFLVKRDIIATAAHCVGRETTCGDRRFLLDYDYESPDRDPLLLPAGDVYACAEVLAKRRETGEFIDYALLRLDRPVLDREPLPLLRGGGVRTGDRVWAAGDPSGLPLKVATEGRIRSIGEASFFTDLDTFIVNSGSPVFLADRGEVAGILVKGGADFVDAGGCQRYAHCPQDGCAGEVATSISLIVHAIPDLDRP